MENQPAENQPTFIQRLGPVFGGLGLVLFVAALLLDVLYHTDRSILLLLVGIGIVLIAIFFFTRPREELREAVTGRRTMYGGNTVLMSVLFIGVVVLVNYLAAQQLHGRVDLTANKQYTLSQQTDNVLKSLQVPVQVIGFFTPQSASQQTDADALLKEYALKSSNFTYRFLDPTANPTLARQYNIVTDGTLVFLHADRHELVQTSDENTFTNAILKVTQTVQPAIYFTTGHGELSPTDSSQTGMSAIQVYLQQTNYKVELLNLASISATQTISGGLPADTSAVVIADPQKPFAAQDEARLKTYLNSGGRILLMVNPQSDPGLQDLLASWGLTLTNDLVLDQATNANYRGYINIPFFSQFPSSPVTANLQQYGVFLPNARSIESAPNNDKNPTALFTTSADSCDKTDLAALQNQQQIQCDPAKDKKGPFVLGYAESTSSGTVGGKEARLIVIGNANFASNQFLQTQDSQGNAILIQNMVNWLAGQEQLIAIPAKTPGQYPLQATTEEVQSFIVLSNVALVPVLFFLLGAVIWWRRR